MLVRLLYASRSVDSDSGDAIAAILARSQTYNPANGITGFLCHGHGVFLQVLEGGRDCISALYSQIQHDKRHKDLLLLSYEEIDERRFGGWTMGQVNIDKVNTSVLLKYSEKPVLDPYSTSAKVSFALLQELMVTASVAGRA